MSHPHVVIVGAGFGGLWCARTLANVPLRVTLLDRRNYHTFFRLPYQVAAAEPSHGARIERDTGPSTHDDHPSGDYPSRDHEQEKVR